MMIWRIIEDKDHFLFQVLRLKSWDKTVLDPFIKILVVHHVMIITGVALPDEEILGVVPHRTTLDLLPIARLDKVVAKFERATIGIRLTEWTVLCNCVDDAHTRAS